MVAHYKPDVIDLHQELKTPSPDRCKGMLSHEQEYLLAGTNPRPGEPPCD
jgi:hypothetical protein